MKSLAIVLMMLIALIQFPLWTGKGGWFQVHTIEQDIIQTQEENLKLQNRNMIFHAEINDLKQGTDAIEERARNDIGMIKKNEIFFQIVETNPTSTIPPAGFARANQTR
ncbi:MAG: cell division protein FtsB [Nitrosomonas sp.]|nr:cell division protein FtsB [Nitrosomonas sp.]MCW5617886.1 cell division protein FtsB [Nitrosomonas sp.]